jgi:hypothetical protein
MKFFCALGFPQFSVWLELKSSFCLLTFCKRPAKCRNTFWERNSLRSLGSESVSSRSLVGTRRRRFDIDYWRAIECFDRADLHACAINFTHGHRMQTEGIRSRR